MRPILLTLALASMALAGCLTPPGEPLTSGQTAGGSLTVPDVTAAGAEVIRHADAVELVWTGEAPQNVPAPPVPVGVPLVPNPFGIANAALAAPIDFDFTLPVEVTLVEATLTWTVAEVNLNLAVLQRDGQALRTQCRSVVGVEVPAKEYCKVHKVGARAGPEEWVGRVSIAANEVGPEPFELRLNLSVKPFPLLGPAIEPAQRSAALGFWSTIVDQERKTGEPSLKVDGQGNVYIAAPTGKMQSLWRTADGGATFEFIDINARATNPEGMLWAAPAAGPLVVGRGGGDSEVFVTEDGSELYFADLWGTCMSVGSSMDAGESWMVNPLSCELPGTDRQWLWAQPGGHLWMTFNGNSVGSNACDARSTVSQESCGGLLVMHSVDAGRTWPFKVYVQEDQCARGNIAVDADGRWYVGGCNDAGPGVAVGGPGAGSYTWTAVADRSGEPLGGFCYVCAIFTVVDLDSEGNAYVVWADPSDEGDAFTVWLSTSQDQGATWSAPVRVNQGEGNALLPWIAASHPGHVSIAWYQTRARGDPGGVQGDWYVHLAESVNALDAQPAFAEQLVQEAPVQYGSVCIVGSRCQTARNLLDFLMVDIDHHGVSHVAYNDGTMGGSPANSWVMYARMTAGQAITTEEMGGGHGHR